jgi:hypothetical protein
VGRSEVEAEFPAAEFPDEDSAPATVAFDAISECCADASAGITASIIASAKVFILTNIFPP